MFALVFGYPQQESPKPEELTAARREARLRYERFRQESIRVNELAAHIGSEADARAFVDAVADMFADSLPPSWATRGIRERIAHAEYEAVSDPLRQIPEQRVADVWNKYVREIGASEEAVVTAAEIHSMRDGTFAVVQVMWSRGMNQSAWTMPSIFAVGVDGKVAEGCRAVEAIRVIHDLDELFDNLRGARGCGRALSLLTRSRGVWRIRRQIRRPAPGCKRGQTPIRFGPPKTGTCGSMGRITSTNSWKCSSRNCFPRTNKPVQRSRR